MPDILIRGKERKMERLTTHDPNRQIVVCSANYKSWNEIYDRLAAYEDLDEQGRLIVLPCKVGDTVWDTEGLTEEPSRHIVLGFDVLRSLNMAHLSGGQSLPVSEFGNTWFLTRSEAEAALKGVSEDA